jgi:hypothetical protein
MNRGDNYVDIWQLMEVKQAMLYIKHRRRGVVVV